MSESQKLFDSSKEFVVPIFSGGEKRCIVRYPTDQEWITRAARQRTVYDQLGRNKTRARVVSPDGLDAELFAKIRTDKDGQEFSAAEASAVIGRLERTEVKEVLRDGNTYRIKMRVAGAVVEHLVKMPLTEDVDACNEASLSVINGRRMQEVRVNLEPSARLYDQIHVDHSGYAGAVPIPHKDAVVFEVLAQIRALEEEADDPEA